MAQPGDSRPDTPTPVTAEPARGWSNAARPGQTSGALGDYHTDWHQPAEAPTPARRGRHVRTPVLRLIEFPLLILLAVVIAVVIKTFVVQPFFIPSESMEPTLLVDDRVLTWKPAYLFGEIARGDIVVFWDPHAPPRDDESLFEAGLRAVKEAFGVRSETAQHLIKRVVGLEGETIEIRDGLVIIDGTPIYEPYLPPGTLNRDEPLQTVPPGHVFMMGDNRTNSFDSRRFGPIPTEDIIGQAVLRIWPLDRLGNP